MKAYKDNNQASVWLLKLRSYIYDKTISKLMIFWRQNIYNHVEHQKKKHYAKYLTLTCSRDGLKTRSTSIWEFGFKENKRKTIRDKSICLVQRSKWEAWLKVCKFLWSRTKFTCKKSAEGHQAKRWYSEETTFTSDYNKNAKIYTWREILLTRDELQLKQQPSLCSCEQQLHLLDHLQILHTWKVFDPTVLPKNILIHLSQSKHIYLDSFSVYVCVLLDGKGKKYNR